MSRRKFAATAIMVGVAWGLVACSVAAPEPDPDSGEAAREDRNVVATMKPQGAMGIPIAKVDDIARSGDVESVVFGRVSSTKDLCSHGLGFRLLTIAVENSVKREVGRSITVVEDGGIVPTDCLTATLDGKFDESFTPKPGEFVDVQFEGHAHTEVGAEVIAFVSALEGSEYGASHALNRGVQSLFVKAGDIYTRDVLDNPDGRAAGFEATIPAANALERLRDAAR